MKLTVKTLKGSHFEIRVQPNDTANSNPPKIVSSNPMFLLSPALDQRFVFDLVPTPPNDAGEPACSALESAAKDDKQRKGSKGKSQIESSSLDIDCDWVAEHARQVSRMLLGGMNVAGIYIWAAENAFKNSSLKIGQVDLPELHAGFKF